MSWSVRFPCNTNSVGHSQGNPVGAPSHELEIEIINPNEVFGADAAAWGRGDRAAEWRFQDNVKRLLNNIRYMARKMAR